MGRCSDGRDARALVLFDGECGLCHRAVQFIAVRDPHGHIEFAPLQSDLAVALLAPHGIPTSSHNTLVLLDGTGAYTRSTAALRIARFLRAPWPVLYCLIVVPPPLRDAVYRMVARKRLLLTGPRSCTLLPAEVRERIRGDIYDGWRQAPPEGPE